MREEGKRGNVSDITNIPATFGLNARSADRLIDGLFSHVVKAGGVVLRS